MPFVNPHPKICSTSLLNNYMSTNTRDNFLWFCDPCLTKFQNDQGKNESQRLHIIEKKYEDIEMKLEEIKSLCTKEPLVPSIVTSLPSTNPWANSTKLRIMKNGLNGDKANVSVLEDKITPEVNRGILSKELKDGSTVLSCATSTDVPAIQKIVEESFPDHTVKIQKPSKSIVRIVGFKNGYNSEEFLQQLFDRNPSLSSFNTPENYEVISIKPIIRDATTFQAAVKISLPFRKAIHDLKDRIVISFFKCIVYDQLNANRCNKCQRFGHFARDCKNHACCAKCNGDHETKSCSQSDNSPSKCANCVRANKPTHNHRADESACPCYVAEHNKRKESFLKSLN